MKQPSPNSRRHEPASGSTSTEHPPNLPQHSPVRSPLLQKRPRRALLTSMAVLPAISTALPLSQSLTGGYLTSPPSRNYLAFSSNSILPSASLPLSSLPELEPVPHSLKTSSQYPGGTCGSVDGGSRDYDSPMSRMETLLPLNVQTTYSPGEEIEVTVSLYGIDGGGHFEFHACPLTYPEKPTEECFDAHPLRFVGDAYYGAVPDEAHPERAYVPLAGAFENGAEAVRDPRENPAGGEMMEFKYRLRLPLDEELVTRSEGAGGGDAPVSASEAIAPQQQQQQQEQEQAGSMAQVFSAASDKGERRRRQQAVLTPITGPQETTEQQAQIELQVSGQPPPGTWIATQKDDEYTISAVETVPISSVVTDGKGTTTITTLEGVTVIGGGPKVPASSTITWGDKMIYGEGIDVDATAPATDRPVTTTAATLGTAPPIATAPPLPDSIDPADSVAPQQSGVDPQAAWAELDEPPDSNPRYVLLRWHYQTARECYPKGYESYPWPSEWGSWAEPWSGECADDSPRQDHYWNCAEVRIAAGAAPAAAPPASVPPPSVPPRGDGASAFVSEEIATASINVEGVNDAPDAAPDMILVNANELAHLHVLANDIDPDGDDLRISEVAEAQYGYAAVLDGGKEIIYAPDTDFVGLDSFEYTVCDKFGLCATANIDVMVGANSDLIFAKDDKAVTTGANPVAVDVISNDVLQLAGKPQVRAMQPLVVTYVVGGSHGECKVTANNRVRYTADQGFEGRDRCTYTVCMSASSEVCDEGWLMVKVLPSEESQIETQISDLNGTPQEEISDPSSTESENGDMGMIFSNIGSDGSGDVIALDDSIVTDSHDASSKIDVLENDEFIGKAFIADVTAAISGTCEITEDNQILYTPTPGFVGWDRCTYTVCVEKDVCDEGRIKIQVMILPQDTNFSSDIVTTTDKVVTQTKQPVVVDVTANDVALATNKPLTVTAASVALHGKCTVTDDNKVEYSSEAGFTGWDRCQYTVCIGETCNVGQIGIKVTASGESSATSNIAPGEIEAHAEAMTDTSSSSGPIAQPDFFSVNEGEVDYFDVLANDEANGHELSIDSVAQPSFGHAQVVFGRVEYKPDDGFIGLDSFEYTVCNEAGNCDTAKIDVTVASDVSTSAADIVKVESSSSTKVFAVDDEVTVSGSEPVLIDVTANDSSPGNIPLLISSVNKALRGSCEVTSINQVKYTAPDGFSGLDRCIYLACAGNDCDKGRIEVTVLLPTETSPTGASLNDVPPPPADGLDIVPSGEGNTSPVDGLVILPADNGSIASVSSRASVDSNVEKVYADHDSVVTSQNTPILVDVTLNDFINGMGPLTITHAGGSQHGDCVVEGDQVLYSPHDGFVGQDRCGYIVCEHDLCDEGIIRIKVIQDESALKHDKTTSVGSIGIMRSSSARLCSQAALNHEMRKLRGQSNLSRKPNSPIGQERHMTGEINSSCVGSSLVTTAITPTQTITYTSMYHAKGEGSSPQSRSIGLHSKVRSATTNTSVQESYVNTEIAITASADATIMPGFPDQNFGSAQSMLVSSASSNSGRHESILKFDTSSVDASVCSDGIIHAKLTLYSLTSSPEGGTFVTTPNKAWTESEVNWSNAPNSNGIVLSSLGQVLAKTYYDVDVSSALVLQRPLSIRILSGTSSGTSAQYASRDHSDPSLHPILRISCISFDGDDIEQ